MAPKLKPTPTQTSPTQWLKRLSWRVFPRGPRSLYCYLRAFPTGQCWLYNYRLANTFDVTERTIQLWLRWLKRHSLVHVYWKNGKTRVIVVHHFKSSYAWLTYAALPRPKKSTRYQPKTSPKHPPYTQPTQLRYAHHGPRLPPSPPSAKNCAL